jgi:hypothetical protein
MEANDPSHNPQLLWLNGLFALEAFRKHSCLTLSFVFDEYSSLWNSRPAERTRTKFRRCV